MSDFSSSGFLPSHSRHVRIDVAMRLNQQRMHVCMCVYTYQSFFLPLSLSLAFYIRIVTNVNSENCRARPSLGGKFRVQQRRKLARAIFCSLSDDCGMYIFTSASRRYSRPVAAAALSAVVLKVYRHARYTADWLASSIIRHRLRETSIRVLSIVARRHYFCTLWFAAALLMIDRARTSER